MFSASRGNLDDTVPVPQTLNFCFGYMLTFADLSTVNLYFAQGYYNDGSNVNNWWIGSPAIVNSGGSKKSAKITLDGTVYNLTGSGTHNFYVTVI